MNTTTTDYDLSTYSGRLSFAMQQAGKTNQSEFARLVGIKQQTVRHLMTKGKGSTHNALIAELLGVDADWLAYGRGSMLPAQQVTVSAGGEEPLPGSPSMETHIIIPRYNVAAACGEGFLNEHVEVKGGLAFMRSWLREMGWTPTNLVVIYARKDSMWPTISDGSVLLVDLSQVAPESGKIYLLNWFGEERVKRLFREGETTYRVSSDNPNKTEYPDERVDFAAQQGVRIVGRVVWQGGTL